MLNIDHASGKIQHPWPQVARLFSLEVNGCNNNLATELSSDVSLRFETEQIYSLQKISQCLFILVTDTPSWHGKVICRYTVTICHYTVTMLMQCELYKNARLVPAPTNISDTRYQWRCKHGLAPAVIFQGSHTCSWICKLEPKDSKCAANTQNCAGWCCKYCHVTWSRCKEDSHT